MAGHGVRIGEDLGGRDLPLPGCHLDESEVSGPGNRKNSRRKWELEAGFTFMFFRLLVSLVLSLLIVRCCRTPD
jgi:hypothetical protein